MNLTRWMWLAGAVLACGSRSGVGLDATGPSGSEESTLAPAGNVVVPAWPRRCVSDWQTLYEEESGGGGARLVYARDEVVFSVVGGQLTRGEILAVDAISGGRERLITVALPEELWLDRGQLLYWDRQQLFDVALAGGAPALVLDARGGAPAAGAALVTPSELFWTQASANGQRTELRRRSRDTEQSTEPQSTELASFERDDFTATELALGSGVLVVNGSSRVLALPLNGQSAVELAEVTSGTLVGIGGRGAYYRRVANVSARGGDANEYEILRAPVDGAPPTRAWSGAAGQRLEQIEEWGDGWLATGAYYLGGGPARAVIVYVEASGRQHVLACHPGGARIASRPILEGNTLYVATRTESSYVIAKISLSE